MTIEIHFKIKQSLTNLSLYFQSSRNQRHRKRTDRLSITIPLRSIEFIIFFKEESNRRREKSPWTNGPVEISRGSISTEDPLCSAQRSSIHRHGCSCNCQPKMRRRVSVIRLGFIIRASACTPAPFHRLASPDKTKRIPRVSLHPLDPSCVQASSLSPRNNLFSRNYFPPFERRATRRHDFFTRIFFTNVKERKKRKRER